MHHPDFNAPVIRMGMNRRGDRRGRDRDGGPGANNEQTGRRGTGLGYSDRDREQKAASQPLVPPMPEEIMRTIMVMNVTKGCRGENSMRELMGLAGGLRQYYSVLSSDDSVTQMGFAEYRDVDSLFVAIELFCPQPIEVPVSFQSVDDEKKRDAIETSNLEVSNVIFPLYLS